MSNMACMRCDGEGRIMICPDDMCRGSGECFGDEGPSCFVECHECDGEGVEEDADVIDFLNADWRGSR